MNEQEMRGIYQGLLTTLREDNIGLGELASRVEALVEEGKITREKVQVEMAADQPFETTALRRRARSRKSTRNLYRRIDYTEREKLNLLLEAIEAAVINPATIRQETARIFAEQADKTNVESGDVILLSNAIDDQDRIVIDLRQANTDVEKLATLISLIAALREEINGSDT